MGKQTQTDSAPGQKLRKLRRSAMLALLSLTALATIAPALPAGADTEYWDTKRHGRSQNLTSSALNFLTKMHKEKSRRDKNLSQAVALLREAIATDPSDPMPHYILGICLDIKGTPEQAVVELKRAYELDRHEPEIVLATAITYYLSGRYDDAIDAWERVYKDRALTSPVSACMGFAAMRKGDLKRAERLMEAARRMNPSPQANISRFGLALLHYLKGDLEGARSELLQLPSADPHPAALLLEARLDSIAGDEREMKRRLSACQRLLRKGPVHRSMKALGFSKQHDFFWDPFDTSLIDSSYIILANDLDGEKSDKRRQSLARKGETQELKDRLKRLLAKNGDDLFALRRVGEIEMAEGNWDAAASSFSKVLMTCPSASIDLLNLGYCMYRAGKGREARDCLDKYMKRYPEAKLAERYKQISRLDVSPEPESQGSTKRKLPGEGDSKGKDAGSGDDSMF